MPRRTTITVDRIESALDKVAWCIASYGDEALPIYERLENERDALLARTSARERALRRAGKARPAPAKQSS